MKNIFLNLFGKVLFWEKSQKTLKKGYMDQEEIGVIHLSAYRYSHVQNFNYNKNKSSK